MKKYYYLMLVILMSTSAYGQTLTVIDKKSNEPIELATIASKSPNAFVTTDENGQADISALKGSKKIEIRIIGYTTFYTNYENLGLLGFKVEMERSTVSMDEIVISATKWELSSSEVPSKITAISSEEVALQNPQTAADLLNVSGQVYIQKSQQGGGSPMIRGFATNRLLYTIDGVRMNTAIFRGGNLQNVISLDPFAIESTEVFFGPGSVIYGSDAIGGVMSFQTLTPKFSTSEDLVVNGNALIRTSSANNEKTGHFDVNVGGKKWAFVSSFSSWDYDHLKQGSDGPEEYLKPYNVQRQDSTDIVVTQDDPLLQIPTAYSQINMMQKLRFSPNAQWDIQYGFHFSETSPYGRYDRHNRVRNGTARYAEWNYGPQKWMMHNLVLSHQGISTFYDRMNLRLAYQKFEESRIDRSLNRDVRNTQVEELDAYSLNLDLLKAVGLKNTLNYGFEYITNDVNSTGFETDITTNTDTEGPSRYPQSTWKSMAIYINSQYKATEALSIQAGLRYNQFVIDATFDDRFYNFPFQKANLNKGSLTGSLGAVLRPTEKLVINANFGTAFRSPNIDDIGKVFDSEPGAVTVPNPDLDAEYAYNFDFGVAKVFGNRLKLDATAYYTILDNAMVRRNFTLNGADMIVYEGELSQVQAIQNAASATVYGLQAGMEFTLLDGFQLISDLNYQKGEEELDDGTTSSSRHAAPLFGTSRLKFNHEKVNLEFYVSYQGEVSFEDLAVDERGKDEIYAKDSKGNNYAPSWYTLNLKAMFPVSDKISISTGLENITDQRYRPYSSGVSSPGRNFIIALRASF
ncbi:TonB-dependent receptor [Fulvivirga lutimaris]|uniref:TonB-dependent receptor n=1 Tax=Fulvivirga lutimaris TaxID=1819566 RepID=UPI0012BB7B9E|nr:TonB-dependent receptor [Fulvivirga lutimaris]MTI38261.1 TonB-dependent receptor [Fulvivirga lutimaris]